MIRHARSAMSGILFGASTLTMAGAPTQRELDNAASDSANWLYVDHDYQGTRYSALRVNRGRLLSA